MKTIAVYNNKGGVGKTVTTVNMAYELSQRGYRVLVIDMDLQGNVSLFFKRYDLNKTSVVDLLKGTTPSRCRRRTSYKGIDIVASNIDLRTVSAESLVAGRDTLNKALKAYESLYDYCIIDCPPGADFIIEVIMATVEDVIIPLKSDRFSINGLETVLDIIYAFADPRVHTGCLFTQFYRNRETVGLVQNVIRTTDVMVYDNLIRRCAAVDHSLRVQRPLAKCASRSTATQDYRDFTEEYLEKEDKTWHCLRA